MSSVSLEEVAKHNKESDCWIVVDNKVYDVTKFLSEHPGLHPFFLHTLAPSNHIKRIYM